MKSIILVAHNIRSAHNVGSLLRTAEGLGLQSVYLTGYSPYPRLAEDRRLPHEANKTHKHITKTSLGAENSIKVEHRQDVINLIKELKSQGITVFALEQDAKAEDLIKLKPPHKVAIIVGREVEGIEAEILKQADKVVQIPMFGQKESFNVAVAAAMALYHLRFN